MGIVYILINQFIWLNFFLKVESSGMLKSFFLMELSRSRFAELALVLPCVLLRNLFYFLEEFKL